jgi:hypothetical protein
MAVFRCTRKLLSHLDAAHGQGEPPHSTTRLGDWHANRLIVHRQHLVLAVSSKTLLPVVVFAAPYKSLLSRLTEAACQLLRALNVDEAKIASEEEAMRDSAVAPLKDFRVLGSMNDFARGLEWYLRDRTPAAASLVLTETPCGPLGMKSPRAATLDRFAIP